MESRYSTVPRRIAEPLAPIPHLRAGVPTPTETPFTASSHSHYPSARLHRRLTTALPFVLNSGQVYFESSALSQQSRSGRYPTPLQSCTRKKAFFQELLLSISSARVLNKSNFHAENPIPKLRSLVSPCESGPGPVLGFKVAQPQFRRVSSWGRNKQDNTLSSWH